MPIAGDPVRRATAEFVGTFAFVFVGAGTMVYARVLTDVALAFGLVIAAMICAVGHISGGHFNPAVTLGYAVTRRITASLAVVYWVTQFVAAIAAAALLRWVLPSGAWDTIKGSAPVLGQDVSSGHAVVIEAVLTFFIVWVALAALSDPRGTFRQLGGIAVGFTYAFGVLMAWQLTGAALNPARALGPELLANQWANAWVWYLGPFAGGAVAAVVYELLYLRARPVAGTRETALDEPRPGDTALS